MAVHGAQLALDLGGQLLGLGLLAVRLLGPAGLGDEALGEAGAGAVEPFPCPGDPVDEGQVGVEHGLLEGTLARASAGSSAPTRLARNQPGPAM